MIGKFMVTFKLKMVLSLFVCIVCASNVVSARPTLTLTFQDMFRASKTGVLTMPVSSFSVSWLESLEPRPEKRSVDSIWNFLTCSSSAFRCCLDGEPTAGQQNVLAMATEGQGLKGEKLALEFLTIYAVYRTVMYGRLSQDEAAVLKSSLSKKFLPSQNYDDFTRLVEDLAETRCRGDIFRALATNFEVIGVSATLSGLNISDPAIVHELVQQYVEQGKYLKEIPKKLFLSLDERSKYDLARVQCVPEDYYSVTYNSYILSKFSMHTSDLIRKQCLNKTPKHWIYEEETEMDVKGEVKEDLGRRADNELEENAAASLNPRAVPNELWLKIFLCCNSRMFRIYVLPMVCKVWKKLHFTVLKESLDVQKAFLESFSGIYAVHQILGRSSCPWNYFLRSPITILKYYVLCLEHFRIEAGKSVGECIEKTWESVVKEIDKNKLSMSSAQYFGFYLDCCKAAKRRLEFCQMPGVSNEEYFAQIRELVSNHNAIPIIPLRFLERDCQIFVYILRNEAALVKLLLSGLSHLYDKLAIHLFLTKSHISQAIDVALYDNSVIHRLLNNEDRSIEKYLGVIFQYCLVDLEQDAWARKMVELCLMARSSNGLEDLMPLKRIWSQTPTRLIRDAQDSMPFTVSNYGKNVNMVSRILTFFCRHCQDYSEEDLRIVEQALERCGILDESSRASALHRHIKRCLQDPKVTVKFV